MMANYNNNNNRGTNNGKKSGKNSRNKFKGKNPKTFEAQGNYKTNDRFTPGGKFETYTPDKLKSGNDPSWWNKHGQLARDTANISFYYPMGGKRPSHEKGKDYTSVPGILKINYVPVLGSLKGTSDNIILSARRMYDIINAKNSRNHSYDPVDLMMYVVGLANAWSLHSWLRRAVGYMLTYSKYNRYLPEAVMKAMGIAKIHSGKDINQWRNVLNFLAVKLNMLAVPKTLDYFERVYRMNEFIYKDSDLYRASLMFFNPEGFLQFRFTDENHDGAYLKFVPFKASDASVGLTVDDVADYIEKMIRPYLNNTDMINMSTDILKAYGEENCYTLGAVTEDYCCEPVYNPEIMLQIHNAMPTGTVSPFNDMEIVQDVTGSALTTKVKFEGNTTAGYYAGTYNTPRLFNMPHDNPTTDDILVASRLMFTSDANGYVTSCGTEIVTTTTIYYFAENDEGIWDVKELDFSPVFSVKGTTADTMSALSKYMAFDHAPIPMYFATGSSGTTYEVTTSIAMVDPENFTTLSAKEIDELHEVALLSIFDVSNM